MPNQYRARLIGLVICSVLALPAYAQDSYIVPAVIHTDVDSKRRVNDEIGAEISIGQFLNDSFAIEARLNATDFNGAGDANAGIRELGVFGRWVFMRENNISPYLVGGVGVLSMKSNRLPDDSRAAMSLGAGLEWRLPQGPWSLRAEYRLRETQQANTDLSDRVLTLGASYAFGKRSATVVPVAAAPDSDGDGVPDSRDQCPETPPGAAVDANGCELDSDGDGVPDSRDQCPGTPAGAAVDASGCELDSDNDGVVDSQDECPNTAEGAPVDKRGCEIRGTIRLEGVNFETNSDRLLPEANQVLNQAAAALRKYPDLVVEIAGHTDDQGDAAYNLGLSERRAETVRDYLIANGANPDSLSARGYGEREPSADNGTAAGRAENRRVELRIIETATD